MEFIIENWTIFLYINNTIDMYLNVWVPAAVAAVLVARKIYKYKKDQVKVEPLLGVAYKK